MGATQRRIDHDIPPPGSRLHRSPQHQHLRPVHCPRLNILTLSQSDEELGRKLLAHALRASHLTVLDDEDDPHTLGNRIE